MSVSISVLNVICNRKWLPFDMSAVSAALTEGRCPSTVQPTKDHVGGWLGWTDCLVLFEFSV